MKESIIQASAETVFAFHEASDAFERLQPVADAHQEGGLVLGLLEPVLVQHGATLDGERLKPFRSARVVRRRLAWDENVDHTSSKNDRRN